MVTNMVFEAATPKLEVVARLRGGHDDTVWQARWSPSGEFLVSCGTDRSVCIWRQNNKKWEVGSKLTGVHTRTIRTVAWSPCGHFLASAGFDATVCVWKRGDGESADFEQFALLEGHESEVKCLTWSPNGEILASCSRDRSIWIWGRENDDDESFECIEMLSSAHSQDVKSVVFHPGDSSILASCGYDDLVCIHRGEGDGQWSTDQTLSGHTSTVWSVSFAPCGGNSTRLASGSADGTVRLWKQSPQSKQFGLEAVLRVQGEAQCECQLENESVTWTPEPAPVNDLSWSPNGRLIATISGGPDRTLRIFGVKSSEIECNGDSQQPIFTPAPIASCKLKFDPNSVQFMPANKDDDDELVLAVTTDSPEILLFRIAGVNWAEIF